MELFSLELELFLVKKEKNDTDDISVLDEPGEDELESQLGVGVVGVDAPSLAVLKAFEVVTQVVCPVWKILNFDK
jgi:hypothetical protein